jgi:hypothetical protein
LARAERFGVRAHRLEGTTLLIHLPPEDPAEGMRRNDPALFRRLKQALDKRRGQAPAPSLAPRFEVIE